MMKKLTIIGAGKVGKVFGRRFQHRGVFSVVQILNRHLQSALNACEFIGIDNVAALADRKQLQEADIWMLAVNDDQIIPACQMLQEQGVLNADSIVFHCSGSKASTELVAAMETGAAVASIHPVASFANLQHVVENFPGTICSIEGDQRALAVLLPAIQAIGAQVVQISAETKLLYHAGSVFASNYLVTLLDTALRAYQAAGIPSELALAMAAPLARQSMENVFALGAAEALTGPIARGDMQTVARQQAVVSSWDAKAGDLYQAFTPPTQALAARKNYSEK
ncbi:Rossmann-like and DUF2520 domain-containing protein [Undibacterium sp. Dicai25W]|uniref:Rossmann-like and DUF2520 domain-containing protein n=1 Tax=Undibacterium sp. Dicai25W TaxID=3413034 RepID=UPI003BEFA291